MSIFTRIQVLARISPIKPKSHYQWHTYNGKAKIIATRKGHKVLLQKGHKIGFRPAKTDPNKIRMVHQQTGLTHVFTLTKTHATRLINNSRPV